MKIEIKFNLGRKKILKEMKTQYRTPKQKTKFQ
jgi:hypothetical protein